MNQENKSPTPLSVMLGNGGQLEIKNKTYTIKPISLKDIEDFMKDNLSLGSQLFNIADKKTKEKVNRWLTDYCFDSESNPVSLENAMGNDWDVVDLKEFFKKLCDFSG